MKDIYVFLFCLWFKEILCGLFAFQHIFSLSKPSLQKKAQIPVEDFFQEGFYSVLTEKILYCIRKKRSKQQRNRYFITQ